MAAVRYVTTKGSSLLHLICHVKPGANSKREGIIAVTDDVIELCVAAQPKDREANKAVRELVAKVFRVPKSEVEIAKGTKSRMKTVSIRKTTLGDEKANIEQMFSILRASIES